MVETYESGLQGALTAVPTSSGPKSNRPSMKLTQAQRRRIGQRVGYQLSPRRIAQVLASPDRGKTLNELWDIKSSLHSTWYKKTKLQDIKIERAIEDVSALIALEEIRFLRSGRYRGLKSGEVICRECGRLVTDMRVEGCDTCRGFDGSMRIEK